MIDSNSRMDLSECPAPDEQVPLVMTVRRVTLSNGRTIEVKVMRRENAAPWSEEDEFALRMILDVASAIGLPRPPKPGLVS